MFAKGEIEVIFNRGLYRQELAWPLCWSKKMAPPAAVQVIEKVEEVKLISEAFVISNFS